jgi:hypothetical protein
MNSRKKENIFFLLRISFKNHQKHKQQLLQKKTSLLAHRSLLVGNGYNVTTPSPQNKSLPIFILCKGLLWTFVVESGLQNYKYHTGNIASTDGRRQWHIHNTIRLKSRIKHVTSKCPLFVTYKRSSSCENINRTTFVII